MWRWTVSSERPARLARVCRPATQPTRAPRSAGAGGAHRSAMSWSVSTGPGARLAKALLSGIQAGSGFRALLRASAARAARAARAAGRGRVPDRPPSHALLLFLAEMLGTDPALLALVDHLRQVLPQVLDSCAGAGLRAHPHDRGVHIGAGGLGELFHQVLRSVQSMGLQGGEHVRPVGILRISLSISNSSNPGAVPVPIVGPGRLLCATADEPPRQQDKNNLRDQEKHKLSPTKCGEVVLSIDDDGDRDLKGRLFGRLFGFESLDYKYRIGGAYRSVVLFRADHLHPALWLDPRSIDNLIR